MSFPSLETQLRSEIVIPLEWGTSTAEEDNLVLQVGSGGIAECCSASKVWECSGYEREAD